MILRRAAARHGRTLSPRLSRCAHRMLSTESQSGNIPDASSSTAVESWSTKQSAPAQPNATSAASWSASSKKRKQKLLQDSIMSLGTDSAQEHHGPVWTRSRQLGDAGPTLNPAQQFGEFQRIQKNTRSLGSDLEKRYSPTEMIINPPGPEDVSLELLMACQAHLGHNPSLWKSANSRYIFGVRDGIHIISLETIAAHLRRAARVVEDVSYRGGIILFVGTRKGQMEIVTKAAQLAGACHLFTKWTPGTITNRDTILKTQPTKVVDHLDSEIEGFDFYTGTARPLLPDLVVCLNPLENYVLLYECGLKDIPTIGVIDTNVDPSWVTYTIPANDDSLRSVALIGGVLGRAGEKGRKRRLDDASRGQVPWRTSPELSRHMSREIKAAVIKRKEVMGRMQSNVEGFTEEEQKLLRLGNSDVDLQVNEDEMVEMMSDAALQDAKEPAVEPKAPAVEPADLASSSSASSESLAEQLADIEAQLGRVSQHAVDIELAVAGEKPT